jgi:hypothetical protein
MQVLLTSQRRARLCGNADFTNHFWRRCVGSLCVCVVACRSQPIVTNQVPILEHLTKYERITVADALEACSRCGVWF